MCRLLESICHIMLKNLSEAEPNYQQIVARNTLNVMMLHELIKKICNGSACDLVDNVIDNAVENTSSLLLLRGNDYVS